jgi:sialidase-1
MRLHFAIVLLLLMCNLTPAHAENLRATMTLFRADEGGYHTYRIPALLRAKDGSILAFAEGRKNGRGDSGEINIVMKRSTNNGDSFGPQQLVWADGPNTCGNPCPVLDEVTGTIWLLLTHNRGDDHEKEITIRTSKESRIVWVMHSDDNGLTWSKPTDITADVKKPDWTWYATGPGIGIQMKHGPHAGRLVIPCDHSAYDGKHVRGNSHVIYSDDHGKTWKLGGEPKQQQYNESQIVELDSGKLMLNMRIHGGSAKDLPHGRGIAISEDGGETFVSDYVDANLPDPRCQGSILRYSWPDEDKSQIVFANVANESERKNLAVRVSFDEGKTWAVTKPINNTWAAYSSLARLSDGRIGLLYETGDAKIYQRIDFMRFPVSWLEDANANAIQWKALPDLPEPLGLAGAFAGINNAAVLFAGGANFPKAPPWQGGEKAFANQIHLLRTTTDGGFEWHANIGTLARPVAYGVSISAPRGVIFIGGCDASRCYADVYRASLGAGGSIRMENLPSLPQPLAFATGTLVGNAIYIAGGQNSVDHAVATDHVYRLDLAKEGSPQFAWEELPRLPKARVLALSAATREGFYVFSGRRIEAGESTELLTDAYHFDPRTNRWESLPSIPRCAMAGSAITLPSGKILLLGGDSGEAFLQAEKLRFAIDSATDSQEKQSLHAKLVEASVKHPGFAGTIVEFDPSTRIYRDLGALPKPAPVTAPAMLWNSRILLLSGEIRAAVRSPNCWLGNRESEAPAEPNSRDASRLGGSLALPSTRTTSAEVTESRRRD